MSFLLLMGQTEHHQTDTAPPRRDGYAARATPAKPADQHEHRRWDDDLGITETSA